ncbi:MAG: hypothetical protein ACLT33_00745 [Lachnospira pectinoschiza]
MRLMVIMLLKSYHCIKSSDDSAKADALVKVRAFIAIKDCAEAVCK